MAANMAVRSMYNKNMKDADHFFFYAIDPWPGSSDIIRYPTSPYCKYTLVNISMQ